MLSSGYWRVASWHGVPIRLHWTIPVGMLFLGGFKIRPLFWLAFFVIVLVHELGHAYWVHRFGHKVHRLDITGFGGACVWSGNASGAERSLIAWGGVIAQLCLLAVAVVLTAVLGWGFLSTSLGYAWTVTNVFLIILNLIPVSPFDGAEAWKIFSAVRREGWPAPARRPAKSRTRRARRVRKPGGDRIKSVKDDGPAGVAEAGKRKVKRQKADKTRDAGGGEAGGEPSAKSGATQKGSTTDQERRELADTFARIAEEARRAKNQD